MAQIAREYRKITVSGLVQGVGFRPAVLNLAVALNLSGWVRNAGGAAECALSGDPAAIAALIRGIRARFAVFDLTEVPIPPFPADGFSIAESGETAGAALSLIPPDAPVCDGCLAELRDPLNRRRGYPFISCAACGPRYTILARLPYDRAATSMAAFPMCPACAPEYADPRDRRFHAQTVGCHACGPRYGGTLEGAALQTSRQRGVAPLESRFGADAIRAGGIIAIKGIGGFHLACLPEHAPVEKLRAIKEREGKPFAVMFRAIQDIEAVCDVSDAERDLLTSFARPIVLLNAKGSPFSENVARGSLDIGCFLPYAPVHHLLLDELAQSGVFALVMTSANKSGEPIIHDAEGLSRFAPGELAGILDHDRAIINPLDDSVARVIDGAPQILRRARGYAPLPIRLEGARGECFCAGGDLKSAFAYGKGGYAYLGPHVGDLADEGCLSRYAMLCENMKTLLRARPTLAARDLHPRYLSAEFAGGMGLPTVEVQHHHAHIASVLAEHDLTRAIGVAFDGTGYGTDGGIWGGEFLLCEGAHFERAGHLLPLMVVGGDAIARDADKLSAFYLHAGGLEPARADWPVLERALRFRVNTATQTSMGRLFDAASAILGICGENEYEGECAIRLERAATLARRAGCAPADMAFGLAEGLIADWRPVIRVLAAGGDVPALALGFHAAVADMVARACAALREKAGWGDVALSGGVFQNRLLTDFCLSALRARGFRVFLNRQVPPGDGGIALGQAYIATR